MSKAGGLFLILGGLAVAAYGIFSDNNPTEPEIARRAAAQPVPAYSVPVVVTIAQRPSDRLPHRRGPAQSPRIVTPWRASCRRS
jgi:hypothetical protein